MASHSSAAKSARHSERVRTRNRMWKSKIKSLGRKLEQAVHDKKNDVLKTLYPVYVSTVDKAASRGIIHKKNASRKKERMSLRVKNIHESPPSGA